MKNYQLLFDRGVKYNRQALENWEIRKAKMQSFYIHPNNAFNVLRLQRIMRLIGDIDDRAGYVSNFLRFVSTKRLEEHLVALQATLNLICPSLDCRSVVPSTKISVPLKSYTPGRKQCSHCGQNLVTEEDLAINDMFKTMGIPFSSQG